MKPAPFPACLLTHWLMWSCIEWAVATGSAAVVALFLFWELIGLVFYSRWLAEQLPYERGATP